MPSGYLWAYVMCKYTHSFFKFIYRYSFAFIAAICRTILYLDSKWYKTMRAYWRVCLRKHARPSIDTCRSTKWSRYSIWPIGFYAPWRAPYHGRRCYVSGIAFSPKEYVLFSRWPLLSLVPPSAGIRCARRAQVSAKHCAFSAHPPITLWKRSLLSTIWCDSICVSKISKLSIHDKRRAVQNRRLSRIRMVQNLVPAMVDATCPHCEAMFTNEMHNSKPTIYYSNKKQQQIVTKHTHNA